MTEVRIVGRGVAASYSLLMDEVAGSSPATVGNCGVAQMVERVKLEATVPDPFTNGIVVKATGTSLESKSVNRLFPIPSTVGRGVADGYFSKKHRPRLFPAFTFSPLRRSA